MSENRQTEIVDEIEEQEIEAEEVEQEPDPKEIARDELFEKMKDALIEEKRLLRRFHDFCDEHSEFEYDEMGMNIEESEDILRKANKIRDKLLGNIEENLSMTFDNVQTNTITKMMAFTTKYEDFDFKVVAEVSIDSFDLEVL